MAPSSLHPGDWHTRSRRGEGGESASMMIRGNNVHSMRIMRRIASTTIILLLASSSLSSASRSIYVLLFVASNREQSGTIWNNYWQCSWFVSCIDISRKI